MRLSVALLTATLLTGSLAGCTSGYGVPQTSSMSSDSSTQSHFVNGGLIPHGAQTANIAPVELRSSSILAKIHAAATRDQASAVTPGIYADVYAAHGSIYAYRDPDRSNGPPVCSVPAADFNDIAVDRQGDLMVPDSDARTVTVYAGPGLCGPKLGTIADPYGEPSDVASRNARSGKIVVGNYRHVGSVSVCTLKGDARPT